MGMVQPAMLGLAVQSTCMRMPHMPALALQHRHPCLECGLSLGVLQESRTPACSSHKFEHALAQAFCRVDEEFGKGEAAALVGTTVVVALVGSRHLYIANCGMLTAPHRHALSAGSLLSVAQLPMLRIMLQLGCSWSLRISCLASSASRIGTHLADHVLQHTASCAAS